MEFSLWKKLTISKRNDDNDEKNSREEAEKNAREEAEKKLREEAEKKNTEEDEKKKLEESLISNLLSTTLDIMRDTIKVQDDEEVRNAYAEIKHKFTEYEFSKIDFDKPNNLIAYFYAYSLLNVTVSRDRFLHEFKNCRELQKGVQKQNLNIISLGGGPGTDMIGFCSALQDYNTDTIETINLTVVDLWKGWASIYTLIEFLIREGDYGNVSKIFQSKLVSSTFITADLLSNEQPSKYKRELAEADIVLLVRVLDTFNFKEVKPEDVIRKIVSGMKYGALLVLIDSVVRNYEDPEVSEEYNPDLEDYILTVQQRRLFSFDPPTKSNAGISIFMKKNPV